MGDRLNLEVSLYWKELAVKLPLITVGEAIEQREKILRERERDDGLSSNQRGANRV